MYFLLDAAISRHSLKIDSLKLPPLHFGVYESIYNFTGRDAKLKILKNSLTSSCASNLTVVSGMGGVGKTSLVRHFVNLREFNEWNIFWLPTETEEELKASFCQAAKAVGERIGIDMNINLNLDKDFEKQLEEFYNFLDLTGRKGMLICDNADDKYCKFDDSRLGKYFSRSIKKHFLKNLNYEHPKVIVTTRRENFLGKFDPIRIKLSLFATAAAIKLCEKSLNSFSNASVITKSKMREDIKRLCSCLGNYPLALQQSISNLNEMMGGKSFDNLIEEFRNTVKIFESQYAEQKVDDCYPHTVATVFDLSLEAIGRMEKAVEMMHVLSFCKPESTEVYFVERLYGNASADALAALMRFNLIARDLNNRNTILIHRVVQRVVQDCVLSKPEFIEIVFRAGIIAMYPFSDGKKYSVSDMFPIIEHLGEKNEKIGQPGCTIQKNFDRDCDLVQTNEIATFIVLSVAFFQFHSDNTLQEMFRAVKLQIARDLLKQTCFRYISDAYFFPNEINQILWESTVRNKTLSSLL